MLHPSRGLRPARPLRGGTGGRRFACRRGLGGKWRATGADLTFCYTFSEVIVINGTFTALVEVHQTGTLSADGTTYTAHGTGSVYDPATGNLLTVNHTHTHATRA